MEVYSQIKKDIAVGFIILAIFYSALELFEYGYDSTDGESRSGMSLHIDNMTGCHYLGGRKGGITPRLDSQGKPYCD